MLKALILFAVPPDNRTSISDGTDFFIPDRLSEVERSRTIPGGPITVLISNGLRRGEMTDGRMTGERKGAGKS